MPANPKSTKKYSQAVSLFYTFGICVQNVGEIDPKSQNRKYKVDSDGRVYFLQLIFLIIFLT